MVAKVVEETRSQFWRAMAYEKLRPAILALKGQVDKAIAMSGQSANDRRIDPMVAINYQRELLNVQRDLHQLNNSIAGATDQLRQAIGAPHNAPLQFLDVRDLNVAVLLRSTAADDVARALRQRPEVRQVMLDLRISEDEIDAALLQLLPGVSLSVTSALDADSHLLHANWVSWGAKIAGNLISLIRLPDTLAHIDAQKAVQRQNAVATAVTIAAQVHVARTRMSVLLSAYHDAVLFEKIQRDLLYQVKTGISTGSIPQQALIREKYATLLAEVRAILAYGDLYASWATLRTATGDDFFDEALTPVAMVPNEVSINGGAWIPFVTRTRSMQ